MKHRLAFIFAYFWLFLLFCAGLGTLIFADKEERASNTENRMLSGFPDSSAESIFSGEFSSGFESFLSDGIFMRDTIANSSDSLLGLFSAASYEDTMLLDSIAMAEELSGGITAAAEQEQDSASAPAEPSVKTENVSAADTEGEYGLFMQLPDGGLELLSDVSLRDIAAVAETLNAYRSFLPEDGNVFYSCVPLTSYRDVAVKSGRYTGWYENLEQEFDKLLVDGAHMVSAPNTLNEHLMDEHLYFQADHHWTPRAANYLVQEMMRRQGLPTVPYEDYEYKINQFYNYATGEADDLELMYPLLPARGNEMPNFTEGSNVEIMLYDYNDYVAYLSGGPDNWARYITGFSTGRKALAIGDSFVNAFIPYLMPYYDEVYSADPRYFNRSIDGAAVSRLIEHYGIDDVYIILSYDNGVDSAISKQILGSMLYE